MANINMQVTAQLKEAVQRESEKAGFNNISIFVRIIINAGLKQIGSKGFHKYMDETAQLKKSLNESREF